MSGFGQFCYKAAHECYLDKLCVKRTTGISFFVKAGFGRTLGIAEVGQIGISASDEFEYFCVGWFLSGANRLI